MKNNILTLSMILAIGIILNSCGNKVEKLTDPQIDATIGIELGHYWNMATGVISPDGKHIATSSYDGLGNVIIWNIETKHQVKKIACPSHEAKTYSFNTLAYNHDGTILAVGADNSKLLLFDAKAGTKLHEIEINRYSGKILAFSHNGKYIAVSSDTLVKVVEASSGTIAKTLVGHTKYITDVEFSADDLTLASSSGDNTVRFWEIESEKEIKKLDMEFIPNAIEFNENASKMAISMKDERIVQVWDLEKYKDVLTINDAYTTSMVYHENKIYTQNNARIDVYNDESGEKEKEIKASGWNLSISPDKKYLANSGSKGAVIVDLASGSQLAELGQDTRYVSKVHVSPTGKFIVTENSHKSSSGGPDILSYSIDTTFLFSAYHTSGSGSNIIDFRGNEDVIYAEKLYGEGYYYDLTSGKSVSKIEDKFTNPLCITSDGVIVIAKDKNERGLYAAYDAKSGEKKYDFVNSTAHHYFSGITPDDKYFVLLTMDFFKVFETSTGKEVKDYKRDDMDDVVFLDQTIDGKYIVGQADTKEFKISDILTGEVLYILEKIEPKDAALSPDKKTVAIACKDWTVKTYNLETKQWGDLKGHLAPAMSVTYSPDGKYILSSAQDNQTKIWDATTNKEILTLVGLEKLSDYEGETKDFVVVAPNGRYDGTKAGIEQFIFFEKGGERLPADNYKDKCYTPNLLGRTLGQDFAEFTKEK